MKPLMELTMMESAILSVIRKLLISPIKYPNMRPTRILGRMIVVMSMVVTGCNVLFPFIIILSLEHYSFGIGV